MAKSRRDRSSVGWLVGGVMVAVGQLMLPFVDHETVWSFEVDWLAEPRDGASLLHNLVTGLARAWVTPGALVATLVVLLLVAMAATGRISRWAPAVAAALASGALAATWAAVAFEVGYLQTPRPGLGILVSALGTLVLAVAAWLAGKVRAPGATATPTAQRARSAAV